MLNNNPYLNILQSNLLPPIVNKITNSNLELNQIQGFTPTKEFTDDNNIKWELVKSSDDSTVDIPDPKTIQITDYWNHEFPNLKTKLYVYVVEGIRQPRVETEQPTRVLFQWFSPLWIPSFTPQMITDREWLKANVYAANFVNTRTSKLKAICHINGDIKQEAQQDELLKVDELNGSDTRSQGQNG